MSPLGTRLMAEVAALPEGSPVSAKRLLHLGRRAAVDQALSRLARRGQLLRAGRGLYLRPVKTRFGVRMPSVDVTLKALGDETGEIIAPHGAASANRLGLTTQVPVREVYLTSGRSRRLVLGAQTVELQHAPGWQLALAGRPAGDVIRVLAWLGRKRGAKTVARLAHTLSPQTVQELSGARSRLPTWMAEQVSQLVPHA
jgi:hypothetical protein